MNPFTKRYAQAVKDATALIERDAVLPREYVQLVASQNSLTDKQAAGAIEQAEQIVSLARSYTPEMATQARSELASMPSFISRTVAMVLACYDRINAQ